MYFPILCLSLNESQELICLVFFFYFTKFKYSIFRKEKKRQTIKSFYGALIYFNMIKHLHEAK